MRNLKRTICLCLSLLMVLGCLSGLTLPISAEAESAESYNVWVLNTQITGENKNDVLGNGKLRYDPLRRILYINGAGTLTGSTEHEGNAVVYTPGTLTVNLSGSSTMIAASYGIRTGGDLHLQGEGKLTINAKDSGIYCGGTLCMDDELNVPTVSIGANYYGIRANEAILWQGNLTARSFGHNYDSQDEIANAGIYVTGGELLLGSPDQRANRNSLTLDAVAQNGIAVYAEGGITLGRYESVSEPNPYTLTDGDQSIADATGERAAELKLAPMDTYEILTNDDLIDDMQCRILTDQPGNRALPGQTVTVSFEPVREGLFLQELFCESADASMPIDIPLTRVRNTYQFVMPAQDVMLYAVFDENPYYEVLIPETAYGAVTSSHKYAAPGETVTLTISPEARYRLKSLSVQQEGGGAVSLSGSGSTRSFTMPEADVTVQAEFEYIPHAVNLTQDYRGTLYSDHSTALPGDVVTVSVAPSVGWGSTGLTVTDENGDALELTHRDNSDSFIMPDCPVTVTASYKGTLTVSMNSNGSATQPSTSVAGPGETVYLFVTLDEGWGVLRMEVHYGGSYIEAERTAEDPNVYRFVMPTEDVSVRPIYDMTYPITVVQQDHGTVTLSENPAFSSSTITVTVTPDEGYRFVGTVNVADADNTYPFDTTYNTFQMRPRTTVRVWLSDNAFEPAETYSLWVGETQVTSVNCTDILGDGTASFDPRTNTLTLNDPQITGVYSYAMLYSELPELTVQGSASFVNSSEKYGIYCASDCALTLDGSFTVSGTQYGIRILGGDLVLAGGSINASSTGSSYAITTTGGSLTIRDSVTRAEFTVPGTIAVNAGSITLGPNLEFETPAGGTVSGGKFKDANGNNVNHVVLARKQNYLPIAVEPTVNGSVSADSFAALSGETVTLTLTPDSGYELKRLTVTDANGDPVTVNGNSFVMPDTAVTVKVTFGKPAYSVYSEIYYGNGSIVIDKPMAEPGEKVTVTLVPAPGYTLDGMDQYLIEMYARQYAVYENMVWDDLTDDSFAFIMPSQQVWIYAWFKEIQGISNDITLYQSAHGTISADKTSATPGTTITLTAVPDAYCKLGAFCVKDAAGNDVAVRESGDNWQFTMPASAVAVTPRFDSDAFFDLYVAGEQVTGRNYTDILGDGVASYDISTNTLRLNGTIRTANGVENAVIYTEGMETLTIESNNASVVSPDNIAILAPKTDLTLTGGFTASGSSGILAKNVALVRGTVRLSDILYLGIRTETLSVPNEVPRLELAGAEGATLLECDNISLGSNHIIHVPQGATLEQVNCTATYTNVVFQSGVTYDIIVDIKEFGTASVPTCAFAGDEVAFTVTPDAGCELKTGTSVTVKKLNSGESLTVTDGKFTMPAEPVVISAEYQIKAIPLSGSAYNLCVGGVWAKPDNLNDILGDGGSWRYNPTTKTLYLNNPAPLTGVYSFWPTSPIQNPIPDSLIYTGDNITVMGTGTITHASNKILNGIQAFDSLANYPCSVTVNGDITIDNCNCGIRTNGTVTFDGGTFLSTRCDNAIDNPATITSAQQKFEIYGSYTYSIHRSANQKIIAPADGKTWLASYILIERDENYQPPAPPFNGYTVNIVSEHGTTAATGTTAMPDTLIDLTFTPDEGYALQSLSIVDAEGNDVPFTIDFRWSSAQFCMPDSDVTVTAHFVSGSHTITLAKPINGTLSCPVPVALPGETVTLSAVPNADYRLKSLTLMTAGDPFAELKDTLSFTMPDCDVVIAADYERAELAITLVQPEHATLTSDQASALPGDPVQISFTTEDGYELLMDNVTVTDENGQPVALSEEGVFEMPALPVIVSAEVDPINYTVNVLSAPNGSVTADKTEAVHVGEQVSLSVEPATGYHVSLLDVTYGAHGLISPTVTANGYVFTMPAYNVTVRPEFSITDYSVTVSDAQHGAVAADHLSANYNNTVTLTVTPDIGYELDTLTVTGTDPTPVVGTNQWTFSMPDADVTVAATFKPINYTITVTGAQHGTPDIPASAHYGDTVCLSFVPEMGYQLDGVTITDDLDEPVQLVNGSFTMPASDVTIALQVTAIDYSVVISPSANGTVTASKSVAHVNDEITLTIEPSDGYQLANLTVYDPSFQTTYPVTNGTFNMPASGVIVVASFTQAPYTIDVTVTGSGAVTPNTLAANPGDRITLTVAPSEGWQLDTLTILDADNETVPMASNRFTMPKSDVHIAATFVHVDHGYTEPLWTWTAYSAATATFTCPECGYTETVDALITVNDLPGQTDYTASVTFNGTDYTNVKTVYKEWDLWVGGVRITGENYTHVQDGVSYNPTTNTLTLNNAEIAPAAGATVVPGKHGILCSQPSEQPFRIELLGTNSIVCEVTDGTVDTDPTTGIYVNSSVSEAIVTGSGTLAIRLSDEYSIPTGIETGRPFTLNGVTVTIDVTRSTDEACGVLLKEQSAELNLTGNASLTINSNSGYATSYAVNSSYRDINVNVDEGCSFTAACDHLVFHENVCLSDASKASGVMVSASNDPASAVLWDGTTALTSYKYLAIPGVNYAVTVLASDHGTVTANRTRVAAGQRVTLTVKPENGYELETLSVKDADNHEITVENNQFTMPASDVTVTATFKASAPVTYTYFVAQSLTLEGDIGINFYVKLNDVDPANAKVVFTWGNNQSLTVLPGDLTADSYGRYKLTVRVAAAEMNDTVTAKLYNGETEVATKQYSVAQYARYVLAASDETLLALVGGNATKADHLRALCKAMLIYGAKSQLQFKYHTYALADQGLVYTLDPVGELGTTVFPEDFETTTGLRYAASSLVLESQTTYRLYFTVTDQAKLDTLTVKLGTDTLHYGTRGSYIYYDIANIPAANVLKDFTLSFGDISVTANAGEYMTKVFANSGQTLQDAITALYWYSIAAKTFFGMN